MGIDAKNKNEKKEIVYGSSKIGLPDITKDSFSEKKVIINLTKQNIHLLHRKQYEPIQL